ncbi:unnamed protein product [Symbiodinium sp. CCMP2456]|nr:unnamed protein product [Symbiodinium sp. CCMP2456]
MVSGLKDSTKLANLQVECSRLGCITFDLPPDNATSGKVLWHAIKRFENLHKKHRPMIFKFGYTHDAVWRWNNTLYGYKHDKAKWSDMKVVYVSKEPFGPSMLEAALISRFESTEGCRNIKSGGDTVQTSLVGADDVFMTYAPCRTAIRTARNVIKDVGRDQARCSGGLEALAKCSLNHSEQATRTLFAKKLKLALPIPFSTVSVPTDSRIGKSKDSDISILELQTLSLQSWVTFLLRSNNWHMLSGLVRPDAERSEKIWKSWWDKFRFIEPNHPVYEMAADGRIDLGRTAAVVLHGDEGRGRRRAPFMVLSFHSVLGRGTNLALETQKTTGVRKPYLKQKLNMKGHSFTTRLITAVLPRHLYLEGDRSFDALLERTCDDAVFMINTGIEHAGKRYHVALIRTVGDWPFLAKSGRLDRSYANTVKRVDQIAKPICHLCEAGTDRIAFEEIGTRQPAWARTVNASSPFKGPPAAARVPHSAGRLAEHFAFDIFHTFHLGVGKHLMGSVIAMFTDMETGNIEVRLEKVSAKYVTWCKENKKSAMLVKITKDMISWNATTDFPKGSWFKAAITTNMPEWAEAYNPSGCPLLEKALSAVKVANKFFRILYSEDVWLSVERSNEAGQLASQFLRRYEQCAQLAHAQGKTLFTLQPKLHPFHHCALDLLRAAGGGYEALNPLVFSTQMSEDLVGRPSRLSRRVDPRSVVKRTLERYLQSAYAEWVSSGLLIESKRG